MAELTEESIIPTEQQPLVYLFSNCDELGEKDSLTTIAVVALGYQTNEYISDVEPCTDKNF